MNHKFLFIVLVSQGFYPWILVMCFCSLQQLTNTTQLPLTGWFRLVFWRILSIAYVHLVDTQEDPVHLHVCLHEHSHLNSSAFLLFIQTSINRDSRVIIATLFTCCIPCSSLPWIRTNHFPKFLLTCVIIMGSYQFATNPGHKSLLSTIVPPQGKINYNEEKIIMAYIYRRPSPQDEVVSSFREKGWRTTQQNNSVLSKWNSSGWYVM